jgi:hypothetical protein
MRNKNCHQRIQTCWIRSLKGLRLLIPIPLRKFRKNKGIRIILSRISMKIINMCRRLILYRWKMYNNRRSDQYLDQDSYS